MPSKTESTNAHADDKKKNEAQEYRYLSGYGWISLSDFIAMRD